MTSTNVIHRGCQALEVALQSFDPAVRDRKIALILEGLTRSEIDTLGDATRTLANLTTYARKASK